MKKRKKKSTGPILLVVLVAALSAVGWGAGPGGWFRPKPVQALEGVPVRRGNLRISVISRGNLEAKDAVKLQNELEGKGTIIHLIAEGTRVQPGDLVCELDSADLRDRRVTQEIAVKNAEAEYTTAREQYDIQVIQNESDIAKAELDLELAVLELEKYRGGGDELEVGALGGEWVHQLAQADEAITIAEEELKQAQETLRWTEELFEKGFSQRTELEGDQLAVDRSRIKLEQAKREKDLMERFEHRKRTAELDAAVATARRDVEKVRKQALAKLADYEAARESASFELARERDKLTKMDDQLSKARIVAPEAGMVVYQRKQGGRMGGAEVPQEGAEVYERQVIATIPRAGGMYADVSLHETKFNKVQEGLACLVTVDALPGKTFHGRVSSKAPVADSGSWMSNPNQRLYKTEVSLDGVSDDMRPGMSCEIEILIDELQDVLYVPRQSVFLDGDRTVCFVQTSEGIASREVAVGLDNNAWAEIKSGLVEGELVLLAAPPSWEPAPATRPDPVAPPDELLQAPVLGPRDDGAIPLEAAVAPLAPDEAAGDGDGAEQRSSEGPDREGRPRGERGSGRPGGFGEMSEEQRAEFRKKMEGMTEEERKAFFERMRNGGGGP